MLVARCEHYHTIELPVSMLQSPLTTKRVHSPAPGSQSIGGVFVSGVRLARAEGVAGCREFIF